MEFNKKQLSPSKIELTVTVSVEEMETYMNEAARKISQDVTIQGFRKGKVPRNVIEQRFGQGSVFQEATNIALPKTYSKIVVDEKIEAVGNPEIDVKKAAHGNPFEYVAIVYVIPEFDAPDISKVSVKKEKVTVEKKEIEEALEEIRKQQATEKDVDRAAKKGDLVVVNFDVLQDGVPIENGKSANHPVVIGEKKFIPGFEDKLIGKKKGEKDEFELKFPKEYHAKHLAGKKALFKVEVKEVKERELPKLDDAFAKKVGKFESLKDLQEKLEENITHEKQHREDDKAEEAMMKKLADMLTIEIPEILISEEKKRMLDEYKQMIEGQGGNFEQYLETQSKTEEQILDEFSEKSVERVKAGLLLRKFAEEMNTKVEDEEVAKEIQLQEAQYAYYPHVMEKLKSPEYKDYMRGILRNRKVLEHLKAQIIK